MLWCLIQDLWQFLSFQVSCDSLTIDPEKWDGHNAPADSSRSEIAATPDVLGQSFSRYHPEMMIVTDDINY